MKQSLTLENQKASLLQRVLSLFVISILVTGSLVSIWDSEQVREVIRGIEWLRVKEVAVRTRWPADEQRVKQWLPDLTGESLLLVDADALVSRIEAREWVKSVTVKKDFPDRIRIHVVPREPKAILVLSGKPHFMDEDGNPIAGLESAVMRKSDLPIVTSSVSVEKSGWNPAHAVPILETLQREFGEHFGVSELVIDEYPYFRVYFSRPAYEVLFSARSWETQLPYLRRLLVSPPGQIGQIHRISLLLPKKAVVRSYLSN